MRTKFMFILIAIFVLGINTCVFASPDITVIVDGEEVIFEDQQPVNIDNHILIPIRNVAEEIGWDVEWVTYHNTTKINGVFPEEHSVVFTNELKLGEPYTVGYYSSINIEDNTKVKCIWGATSIVYHDDGTQLTIPAQIINGRVLVGIRDLADCIYADVSWDSNTKTVNITSTPTKEFPEYDTILDTITEETKNISSNEKNAERKNITEEVIRLTNIEREKVGLHPLKMQTSLMKAADIRSNEIGVIFSHTRPNGKKCITAAEEAGYPSSYVGENIYAGSNIAEHIVNSWMNSEGHRANILNPEYNYIGVAFNYNVGSKYGNYCVQLFAS